MSQHDTGRPAWNKGLKIPAWRKEGNPNWKGDKAGYAALHKWLERNFKKTGNCVHCGEEKKTTWANVDGTYRRDELNWIELCYKCHRRYDRNLPKNHKYDHETKRRFRK